MTWNLPTDSKNIPTLGRGKVKILVKSANDFMYLYVPSVIFYKNLNPIRNRRGVGGYQPPFCEGCTNQFQIS